MTGTGALARLVLRLDRVRLAVWVVVLAIMPLATAAQYQQTYPTQQSLDAVSGVLSNPSLVAINGPLFALTLGGLTAWKIGVTEIVLIALMNLLTVVRHTRTEEETGRLELLGSTVLGRFAPLGAVLLVLAVTDVLVGALVALGLIGTGLPAAGSVAFGVEVASAGLVFAAVAAVTAQLTRSARAANGLATAVLAAAYLLRVIGDAGPTWVSWLSPVGWVMRIRAYADEQWWVVGLALAFAVLLGAVAVLLVAGRDFGAGLVPDRPAPASAPPRLRSSFALAWRLQGGTFLGWLIGMLVAGAVLGGVADSLADALSGVDTNPQLMQMLTRLGGSKGLADTYLAAVIGIVGVTVAAYTVQATLRLRAEESAGLLEPLLATRVGRLRWVASHLVIVLGGTAVLLAVAGVGAGLTYGSAIGDVGGQVGRLVAAGLVQVPAAWVLAGVGVALFGLRPRWSGLAWAGLVVCVLLLLLGALLGLNQWLIDVSPFTHVPKLPGVALDVVPLVWLTLVAAVLTGAGLTGLRRRDIG